MKHFKNILKIFLCLVIFQISCQQRMVVRNGVSLPYQEAARLDYEEAQTFLRDGKKPAALKTLQRLTKNYPDSDYTDVAYTQIGDLYLFDGKYKEARDAFQPVVNQFLFSSQKIYATYHLGIANFKLEDYAQAAKNLEEVLGRVKKSTEILEVNTLIAQSYENLKLPEKAVPFFVNILRIQETQNVGTAVKTTWTQIPDKTFLDQHIREVIQASTNVAALEDLVSNYRDSFPGQFALYRLGYLEMEAEHRDNAQKYFENLASRFPNDPLADQARDYLKTLQTRYVVNSGTIGVILPLSGGAQSVVGQEALSGIELALQKFQDDHAALALRLIVKDDQGNPEKAAKAVIDLVTDHQVIAIIGPLFPGTTQAAAKEAERVGVPLLSLSSVPGIADLGDYIFQTALSAEQQIKTLVDATVKLQSLSSNIDASKRNKFAILYSERTYGVAMRDLFWDEVIRQGGEIVAAESYKPNQRDFSKTLERLVGLDHPEFRATEMEALRRQARDKGKRMRDITLPPLVDFSALFVPERDLTMAAMISDYVPYYDIRNVRVLGESNWNDPQVLNPKAQNMRGSIVVDGFFRDSEDEATVAFVKRFHDIFDQEPSRYSAYAYDSASLLITLLRKNPTSNRDGLKRELLGVKSFSGATGPLSFQPNGQANKKAFILQVEKDRITELHL